MIHWISYVRPVNFNEEFVTLSVADPLQESPVSLCLYFLWISWIDLCAVLSLKYVLTLLVRITWHHHLVYQHFFKSSSLLDCICLYHLLLDN